MQENLYSDQPNILENKIIPADFGLRFLAASIDLILLSFLIFLLKISHPGFSNYFFKEMLHEQSDSYTLWVMKRSSLVVLWIVYSSVMDFTNRRGTIGKQFVGIVVSDNQGRKINFVTSVLRNLYKIISYIVFGLGFFYVLIDRKNRGWHDMLAGTLVLKKY